MHGCIDNASFPTSSATATDFSTSSALIDLSLSSDSSPLSSPPESPVLSLLEEGEDEFLGDLPTLKKNHEDLKLICPICSVSVDEDHTRSFLTSHPPLVSYQGHSRRGGGGGGHDGDDDGPKDLRKTLRRMKVREQKRFCRSHRLRSATEEWARRGYPDIDWTHLPQRVESFFPILDQIIRGTMPSLYRSALEERVRCGRHRNGTLKSIMVEGGSGGGDGRDAVVASLTPGYYGPRGAQILYVSYFPSPSLLSISYSSSPFCLLFSFFLSFLPSLHPSMQSFSPSSSKPFFSLSDHNYFLPRPFHTDITS